MNNSIQSLLSLAAIAKAGELAAKQLKAAGGLPAGKYSVATKVAISGTINKGEDFEQVVNESLPWEKLALALANRVNDETLNAVLRDLDKVDAKPVKARVAGAWEVFRGSARKLVAGKTTAKLVLN